MRNILSILSILLFALQASGQHQKFDADCPDVHDPVMALGEDGRYYIFSTGMGINVMSSADLKTWRQESPVFMVPRDPSKPRDYSDPSDPRDSSLPSWTLDSVPRFHGHIWAPDISKHNGKWYLYYSCSSFGKNGSAIGLATNKTLDPKSPDFRWEDQGCVIVSHRGQDDYNCIDPALGWFQEVPEGSKGFQEVPGGVKGFQEVPYLFFGSFWDGVQVVKLDSTLSRPVTKPRTVARRHIPVKDKSAVAPYIEVVNGDTVEAGENAIEAPFIIYHKDTPSSLNSHPSTLNPQPSTGWYYLFVSWDYCCRGKKSTYKTVYGRSRNIEGPYLDKDGKDMAQGGGTFLVGPDKQFFGVGHCAVYAVHDSRFKVQAPEGSREFQEVPEGSWLFISHAYDISKKGQSKLYIRQLKFTEDGWVELMPR